MFKFERLPAIMLALVSLGCTGRVVVGGGAPEPTNAFVEPDAPWMIAMKERRSGMHRYRYYEHDQVYYDLDSRMYFYQDNYEGPWISVTTLPTYVVLEDSYAVDLDMRSNEPYRQHDKIIHSYPPGQEKQDRKHGKDHGHGHDEHSDRGHGNDNDRH
jgi:hypothetical protein